MEGVLFSPEMIIQLAVKFVLWMWFFLSFWIVDFPHTNFLLGVQGLLIQLILSLLSYCRISSFIHFYFVIFILIYLVLLF